LEGCSPAVNISPVQVKLIPSHRKIRPPESLLLVHERDALVAEDEGDRRGDNRMDEMLDAIWPELETNSKDPPTSEVEKFFDMLRASEEPLQEHTIVSVIAFVTCLTGI
jgi:hypothetical protein